MPGIKVRGYGTVELDEKRTRKIKTKDNEIKLKDLYRDDALEKDDE